MGDGINDAPSLKTSDVGISVDNAVDVARESADIILSKNDLTVLGEGVLEGRKTFGNTMKYIMLGVSSNFGNMFSVAGAAMFLTFLPMLPVQILLNNLSTISPNLQSQPTKLMKNMLRAQNDGTFASFDRFMVVVGSSSSLFDFLNLLHYALCLPTDNSRLTLLSNPEYPQPCSRQHGLSNLLCSQILVVFIIRTRRKPFWKSKPSKYLVISSYNHSCLRVNSALYAAW